MVAAKNVRWGNKSVLFYVFWHGLPQVLQIEKSGGLSRIKIGLVVKSGSKLRYGLKFRP